MKSSIDVPLEGLRLVRCLRCKTLLRVRTRWSIRNAKMLERFSDGFKTGIPPFAFCDVARYYKCTSCFVLNDMHTSQLHPKQLPWLVRLSKLLIPLPIVEQDESTCAEALEKGVPQGPDAIRDTRIAYLRRSNDPFRYLLDERKLGPHQRSEFWRNQVQGLCSQLAKTVMSNVALAIECLRELGRFDEARTAIRDWWTIGEDDGWFYGIRTLEELCLAKNPFVQKVTVFR